MTLHFLDPREIWPVDSRSYLREEIVFIDRSAKSMATGTCGLSRDSRDANRVNLGTKRVDLITMRAENTYL